MYQSPRGSVLVPFHCPEAMPNLLHVSFADHQVASGKGGAAAGGLADVFVELELAGFYQQDSFDRDPSRESKT